MIAFICSNNIIWDISLYPTKGYCVCGGVFHKNNVLFDSICKVWDSSLYPIKKLFCGTPWYAIATLRMTIKDVISSLSRNLKRCLLSKFKGIIFVIIISRRSLPIPHKKVILWGPRYARDDRKKVLCTAIQCKNIQPLIF